MTARGTIRYWAAARQAAGCDQEPYAAETLAAALAAAREGRDARFAQVLGRCSFIVDGDPVGTRDHRLVRLADGGVVEALPPFAGGAADPAPPMSARWEGAAVAASVAAVCGGAALLGRWPLLALVLLVQLALTLAWLALMAVPATSGGLLIIVGAAVVADVYASRSGEPDQAPVVVVLAGALVLATLRQLARRRRAGVTDSLAAVLTGALLAVFAAHLIAARVGRDGVAAAAAICFATAAATLARRGVDALLPAPALRAGSQRGWPGLLASVAAGAATGAYVAVSRTGLDGRSGAILGVAVAIASAVVDLGVGMGSMHLADSRQRSAIAPLVVLLPLVVAAPVGYGVARLLG